MQEARKPVLDRPTAMRLAATEYRRFLATIEALTPADWQRPTECAGWDVKAMASHVLGMANMAASPYESFRQPREAAKRGGVFIDALTSLQVEEHAELTSEGVVTAFAKTGPRAARGRRLTPRVIRRRSMPAEQTGADEPWTLGFLLDVILTRDTWMHRMDIAAATDHPAELTADHDGVLVDDVVREWAGRHGQPCELTLRGPAGGSWSFGSEGPSLDLDAVVYCRILSGREDAEGLLKISVPF